MADSAQWPEEAENTKNATNTIEVIRDTNNEKMTKDTTSDATNEENRDEWM